METTHPQPSPRTGGSPARIVGGVVLLGVLFAVGLVPKLRSNAQLVNETKATATEAPEVEIASPHLAPADPLLLPGNVQAISTTAIQARTSGYVSKLFVDIGSHVKAGQVLAEIESPDADQQVAQANADTAKSRATVDQSQADIAKSQAGVAQSQAELARQRAAIKQAQAAFKGAQARKAQAIAARSQAQAKLAQTRQSVEIQRANLAQARAQLDLATATARRYEGLLKEGFVSQQDYDQAAATFKTTAASVKAVQANIEASQADVRAAEQAVEASSALVQSAGSDADAAQENVSAAQATYQSLEASVNAARANVEASRANESADRAAVASSEANARRYEVLRSFQRVVAPFDGVITSRNVDLGSLVSPGAIATANANATTPNVGLFGIARVDTLRIFVNVPQTNFQSVKPGTKAQVLIRELPNETFAGTISQSAGALDAASRTLLTEVRLPNPKNELLPGMYAQVRIAPSDARPALRVPANTLMVDAQGTRVMTVDGTNHVHIRKVTLGRDYGTEVEVVSGLGTNDRLVANPSDELKDGETVRPSKTGGAA